MSIETVEQILSNIVGAPVKIKINSNKRSFVRSMRRAATGLYLSIHRLFLDAPFEILRALAQFVEGDRRARLILIHFIHTFEDQINAVCPSTLIVKGEHHALDTLYRHVHNQYFPHAPLLPVTWYASSHSKAKRSIVLGLFERSKRLIKIHRSLDRAEVPSLFVEFVLYHEALHNFFLPKIDHVAGKLRLHTGEFKRAERAFKGYRECRIWQRNHLFDLLAAKREK